MKGSYSDVTSDSGLKLSTNFPLGLASGVQGTKACWRANASPAQEHSRKCTNIGQITTVATAGEYLSGGDSRECTNIISECTDIRPQLPPW